MPAVEGNTLVDITYYFHVSIQGWIIRLSFTHSILFRMDNQSPICGGQHSLDQSCYAHDQCPYQQQPSMDPLQYEQSQQVNCCIIKLIMLYHKFIYHHQGVFISISGCWIGELCHRCASLSQRCGHCATSDNTERQGEEGVPEGGRFHKRRRWSPLFCLSQCRQRSNNRLVKEQFFSLTEYMFRMLLYSYELSFWIILRCESDSRSLLKTTPWLLQYF